MKSFRETILVVDDDLDVLEVLKDRLESLGYRVLATANGKESLELLEKQNPQIALLDIEMPGMDGFELCKRLRQLPAYKETPVIYVTGHSDFESRAKSALSGGDDLIGKPVFAMELAVKAMTHLLSNQLAIKPMAA